MRHGWFQTHWHPHHEDFERGTLILYMLLLAFVLTWIFLHLTIFQPSGSLVIKPEPMQLWWY